MPEWYKDKFQNYTKFSDEQSPDLRKVNLVVSNYTYPQKKMFGTVLKQEGGVFKDPCAGDSGGPLMYQIPGSGRWVIIG